VKTPAQAGVFTCEARQAWSNVKDNIFLIATRPRLTLQGAARYFHVDDPAAQHGMTYPSPLVTAALQASSSTHLPPSLFPSLCGRRDATAGERAGKK
jgi:hypothetical protein